MATLVTGASGFLGRNLVRALAERGEEVVALHGQRGGAFTHPAVRWTRFNLGAPFDWTPLLQGVTRVYHLAWSTLPQTSNENPADDAIVNIGGTLRLLEALKMRPDTRFIFASSGGTRYGAVERGLAKEDTPARPRCAYGVSKHAVETYLSTFEHLWGLDHVSLRFSNAYGPDQESGRNFGVVATFVARALAGETCALYGNGEAERDFLYVDDVVSALIAAGEQPLGARAYNIGSGEGRTIAGIVRAITEATGVAITTNALPARDFDSPRTVLDPSLALKDLGWSARTTFSEGLSKVIAAHREVRTA